jgi:predicted  nucleic acid-binding Zn-ribbon protein
MDYSLSKLKKEVYQKQKRIEHLLANEARFLEEKKKLEKKLSELQNHYTTTTKNFYKLLDETEELKKQQQHFRSEKSFYIQVSLF